MGCISFKIETVLTEHLLNLNKKTKKQKNQNLQQLRIGKDLVAHADAAPHFGVKVNTNEERH